MFIGDFQFYESMQYKIEEISYVLLSDFIGMFQTASLLLNPILGNVNNAIQEVRALGFALENSVLKISQADILAFDSEIIRIETGLDFYMVRAESLESFIIDMGLSRSYRTKSKRSIMPAEDVITQAYAILRPFVWFLQGITPFLIEIEKLDIDIKTGDMVSHIEDVKQYLLSNFEPLHNDFVALMNERIAQSPKFIVKPDPVVIEGFPIITDEPQADPDPIVRRRRDFDR